MSQATSREDSNVPLSWVLLFFLTVFAICALTIHSVGGQLIAGLLLA
jgi:hypothetical protein